jgi:hypothetical protein
VELEIRHQFRDIKFGNNEFYVTSFFKSFFKKLQIQYPEHTFKINNDPSYEKFGQGSIYSCMNFSIVNPLNKNYILISFFDNWKYHFMTHLGWDGEKMKGFFYPGGFNYLDYYTFKNTSKFNLDLKFPSDIEFIYKPFFYGPYFDCCYDEIEKIYNEGLTKEKINKLYFRGWLWDFRKEMVSDLNMEDIIIIDKNENNQNLTYQNFLKESSLYSASLSLPGGNEMCNRDIECFGIGVPVIRPSLNINYDDPLIPNYHYISCYHFCDYSDGGHPKYISYEDFKKNLISTWNKVKNNKEYLDFISKNARSWFERNCTVDKNTNSILKKLNLETLF